MLSEITLENFILFEKTAFVFSPGLNAVSGETGAGKSLIARALALGLGGRGGQDCIRAGCDETRIEVTFRKSGKDGREEVVRVERIIRRDGGGRIALDGKAATAQAVRTTLAPLVDFAAQNEQVRLAEPEHQRELLDAYGRLGASASAYADLYRSAETLAKRLRAGREEQALVRLRLEKAREELELLEEVDFNPAVDLRLEEDIREMSSASAVAQAAGEAAALLDAGDPSGLETLGLARRALERAVGVSTRLAEAGRRLDAALEEAQEALDLLVAAGENAEADPARLDAMIGRSEQLKALGRRFGCGVEGLKGLRAQLEKEVADLSEWDAGEDEIKAKLADLLPRLAEAGKALGAKRRAAAGKLAKAVNRELAGLGMEQAGFSVELEQLWREGMPPEEILAAGPNGLEEIGFFLSPNPGEAASSLAHAASGGEASRAVLAIKAALSEVYRPEVMFLDEIDAGVGARLGRELGVKLRELSGNRQIIVITHLPQIASYAETHLKVAKRVKAGRTAALVENLEGEARVEEVAKMIHGNAAGRTTLEQAREMLAEGAGDKR